MTKICEGCGSTETIEQIRARNPNALSCCPERKMVEALPPTGDVVKRLRLQHEHGLLGVPDGHNTVSYGDAADEIERLRSRSERLEAALREATPKFIDADLGEDCEYERCRDAYSDCSGELDRIKQLIDAALSPSPSEWGDDGK